MMVEQMPKIGLFLDAGCVDSGDPCTVEKFLCEKFRIEKCPSMEGCIEMIGEDTVVVMLPKSRLTCATVEEIIRKKNEQERVIDEQRMEIESLKERLSQSDKLRKESLDTVNKLRTEFVDLIHQVTPRRRDPDTARGRANTTYNSDSVPRTSRGGVQDLSKSVPRLWLTSLRK